MHCLVTGAAGFIGSTITDTLIAQGHTVVGVDCFVDYYPREMKERNLAQARQSSTFRFIESDIRDRSLLGALEGIEVVYHQAAQAGVRASWGSSFATYTDNNILATQQLLELIRTTSLRETVRKVVYASSSSVYGTAETLPTNEQILPRPISPYGVSKLAAEHLMLLYAQEFGVPTISLRYFTVYGPRQRPDMGFHKLIRAALLDQPFPVYGDGEQSRDFTFIRDAVEANLLAAQATTTDRVFNIGGGSRVTLNEVIKRLEDILGKRIKVKYEPREAGDARHTAADTTRAREQLSFAPRVSLDDGLRAEAEWLTTIL